MDSWVSLFVSCFALVVNFRGMSLLSHPGNVGKCLFVSKGLIWGGGAGCLQSWPWTWTNLDTKADHLLSHLPAHSHSYNAAAAMTCCQPAGMHKIRPSVKVRVRENLAHAWRLNLSPEAMFVYVAHLSSTVALRLFHILTQLITRRCVLYFQSISSKIICSSFRRRCSHFCFYSKK